MPRKKGTRPESCPDVPYAGVSLKVLYFCSKMGTCGLCYECGDEELLR